MAFWAEGFWKPGFWKPGFWKGMGSGGVSGSFILFYRFKFDLGGGEHNLRTGEFRLALLTDSLEITAALTNPTWGPEGTNLSAYQVRPGGNYPDGGLPLETSLSIDGGVVTWSTPDRGILPLVGSPTDARYGIVYNQNNRKCVGYIDYTSLDLSTQALMIDFSAAGLLSYG
jgi:hypothetical protein